MAPVRNSRWLALIAAGGCLGLFSPPAYATSKNARAAKSKLTNKERARLRKQLTADVRRNPTVVFNRRFLKKADLSDFKLPLTVRLSKPDGQGGFLPSDDQLEIDYDDSANTWPLASSALPAPQTTFLDGLFTMEASFGGDSTGYGEPGALETVQGGQILMTASPFTLADFDPFCASGPVLATDPARKVVISSAVPRYGVMNMFSQEFRGSLSLRMTFASAVTDSCGGTTTVTPLIDNTTAPPMPIRMDGKFYVSPSLTSDGKMRFGKIVIDDSVTPQTSTFAFVRACTNALTCDPQEFPARLKVKTLSADVLLGDIRS
jgi:hypothetical protein